MFPKFLRFFSQIPNVQLGWKLASDEMLSYQKFEDKQYVGLEF